MKQRYISKSLCVCLGIAVLLISGSSLAAEKKNPWAGVGDMEWGSIGTNGTGTSVKMLLNKDNGMVDDVIVGLWLVKVDPGGEYTVTVVPKEDRVFFVAAGQGSFTLADQQIDAKPGDAFSAPAGVKHGIKNSGKEPVELVVFSANVQEANPQSKPVWGRADDMEWAPNELHGVGCSAKMIIDRGSSAIFRGLWLMLVKPGGVNYVHSDAEHQMFFVWKSPKANTTARDSRTHAARWIMGDKIMQTKDGGAFYAAMNNPHGSINESNTEELIYIGVGAVIPRQRGAGEGSQPGRGAARRGNTGQ